MTSADHGLPRLFPIDEIPEVPLFRELRRSRGENDARFRNDYPPEWNCCPTCEGDGQIVVMGHEDACYEHGCNCGGVPEQAACPDCMGMGSLKARVRLEAGHRCVRCQHPYIPKGDAKMLGVEPSGLHDGVWTPWSFCDDRCTHGGPVRYRYSVAAEWAELTAPKPEQIAHIEGSALEVEAIWRILTVHHLDGDKANVQWWNLAALCQRCHLEIQAKVVMERVYPHEHSDWFKPYVAGYYAHVYLGESLTREQVDARLDELLALEQAVA